MIFRYARHTNQLKKLTQFYSEVLGLDILARFDDHDEYDGVFLGFRDHDWHIEFTESNVAPKHESDDEDLLVFYIESQIQMKIISHHAKQAGAHILKSVNPYWQQNGIEFKDPDGFGVLISYREKELNASGIITQLFVDKRVSTWSKAIEYVQKIPYGRNSNRDDFALVIKENIGSCSSKHALLKSLADENMIGGVQLVLCIYKMNEANTPGIGHHIRKSGLDYLPEAHCYLNIYGKRIDLTSPNSDIDKMKKDILLEEEIEPSQVVDYKVQFHQKYIKEWIESEALDLSFEEIWKLREKCIQSLSK